MKKLFLFLFVFSISLQAMEDLFELKPCAIEQSLYVLNNKAIDGDKVSRKALSVIINACLEKKYFIGDYEVQSLLFEHRFCNLLDGNLKQEVCDYIMSTMSKDEL